MTPHQWLMAYASKKTDTAELYSIIEALAYRLDSESIVDLFHDVMEHEGASFS
jgi:hypothetical protein